MTKRFPLVMIFPLVIGFYVQVVAKSSEATHSKWQEEVTSLLHRSNLRVKAYYKKKQDDLLYNERRLRGAGSLKEKREKENVRREEGRKKYASEQEGKSWQKLKLDGQRHSDYLLSVEIEKKRRYALQEEYAERKKYVSSTLKERNKIIPSGDEFNLNSNWSSKAAE